MMFFNELSTDYPRGDVKNFDNGKTVTYYFQNCGRCFKNFHIPIRWRCIEKYCSPE